MPSKDQDLKLGSSGPMVQLLQNMLRTLGYEIPLPPELTGPFRFDDKTRQAVLEFQKAHGLATTGVVDGVTWKLIADAFAELMPSLVRGRVRDQKGKDVSGVLVRAFDRDLRSEEPLGDGLTDAQGSYRIPYDAQWFRRAEKGRADLVVRVLDAAERVLAESPVLFNAPAEAVVDLTVTPRSVSLSEYESLLEDVTPALDGVAPEDLTDEDLTFLNGDTGVERARLEVLRRAAQLSRQTQLQTEVFYGLGRQGLALELPSLLERDTVELVKTLKRAIEAKIVPAALEGALEDIAGRFDELRAGQPVAPEPERVLAVEGRLLDATMAEPLSGFVVRVLPGKAPPLLSPDEQATDHAGFFRLFYVPDPERGLAAGMPHRLALQVLDSEGRAIHDAQVELRVEQDEVLEVRATVPAPASPALADVAKALKLDIPAPLQAALEQQQIRTLADIRRIGGLKGLEGLAEGAGSKILDAHASLDLLPGDLDTKQALIGKGLDSPSAIYERSRSELLDLTRGEVNDARLLESVAAVRAQESATVMALGDVWANGRFTGSDDRFAELLKPFFDQACTCEACRSAVSPAAYLADLLRYTLESVRHVDGRRVSLQYLAGFLGQPLQELPTTCAAVERRVHQVRLCVEVLQRWLTGADAKALREAEARYCRAAYDALLRGMGTSSVELRTSRRATAEQRAEFALRLGFALDAGAGQDRLDRLLLDEGATLDQPQALSQASLARLFGLPNTWRADLTHSEMDVTVAGDLQHWRLERLRAHWREQDERASSEHRTAVVDPEVIEVDVLKHPRQGDAAYDLLRQRQKWLHAQGKALEKAAQGGLASLVAAPESEGSLPTPFDSRVTKDIDARLQALGLVEAEISRIRRLRGVLDSGGELIESEWNDIISLLMLARKRTVLAQWRKEELEAGVLLGPDHFQLPKPDPSDFAVGAATIALRSLGNARARRDWEETLRARIEQEQGTLTAHQNLIAEVEDATLPAFRDALLSLSPAPGTTLSQRARWVSENLLIDAENAGQQETTRVGQAIESLQSLLWALRTGQLERPRLELKLDADDFDVRWQWMGSFAAWRAALFVFLYPENIAIPSLRRQQTPAFRRLVSELRDQRRLTPAQACDAVARYESYFADICSLEVQATCQTLGPVPSNRPRCGEQVVEEEELFFLFALAPKTRKVYVSIVRVDRYASSDARDDAGAFQSFWDSVPELTDVISLIGAAPYVTGKQRRVLLFARIADRGVQKLVYVQYDIDAQHWQEGPTELELPKRATAFTAVMKQSHSETQPPHLVIRIDDGAIYDRIMNADASDWAEPPGAAYNVGEEKGGLPLVGAPKSREFTHLCGMLEITRGADALVARDRDGRPMYRLLGDDDDGYWRQVSSSSVAVAAVFRSPGAAELVVGLAGSRHDSLDARSIGLGRLRKTYNPHQTVQDLDQWLREVTGATLANVFVPRQRMNLLRILTTTELLSIVELYTSGGATLPPDLFRRFYRDGLRLIDRWWATVVAGKSSDFRLAPLLFRQFSDSRLTLQRGLRQTFKNTLFQHHAPVNIPGPAKLNPIRLRHRPPGEEHGRGRRFSVSPNVRIARVAPTVGPTRGGFKLYGIQAADGLRGVFVGHHNVRLLRLNASAEPVYVDELLLRPASPRGVPAPRTIPHHVHDAEARRRQILTAFERNRGAGLNRVYLEEAYYFVPVHVALQLQQRGHFVEALDWFRTVYDYTQPTESQRNVYYGLRQEKSPRESYARSADWLSDPLNPHSIAAARANTYARFTLQVIIRCLLEYADSEFTLDTAESLPKARFLYRSALALLDSPRLVQTRGDCDALLEQLTVDVGPMPRAERQVVARALRAAGDHEQLKKAAERIKVALGAEGDLTQRFEGTIRAITEGTRDPGDELTLGVVIDRQTDLSKRTSASALTSPAWAETMRYVGQVAGARYVSSLSAVAGVPVTELRKGAVELPWLRQPTASAGTSLAKSPDLEKVFALGKHFEPPSLGRVDLRYARDVAISSVPSPMALYQFCIPANPVLRALRLQAELSLHKLRTGRNIAGLERQVDPYTVPVDNETGLPFIGAGGQLVLPGLGTLRPTAYRYNVLVDRAKQLIAHAQQIEAALLGALEKRDAEAYAALKARQELRMTKAHLRLQDLKVSEAEGGVALATLQQGAAMIRAEHYQHLLTAGMTASETASIILLWVAVGLKDTAAGISKGKLDLSGGFALAADAAKLTADTLQQYASFERRQQEWDLQQKLAEQDILITGQQIQNAQDRVRVVGQEREIADLQATHTEAVVDFLSTKFTNVELYDWMSGVLEGVYSFFLQQATSIAQLAAAQLAFERQEPAPVQIQADYWTAPNTETLLGDAGNAPDRRGLTGSARLLQDLYQLDQHAFDTNRRKLQLTKTLSLAQLAPEAFLRFRAEGVLRFDTPMALFDRDFPGHYLRLIRRVRTSVIALVPPTHGIRATLTNGGVSRVVIGGPIFQRVPVVRGPEQVALSSPRDATGLFELDPQSELLLPFEGLGVDTSWELRMPKPANPFDYDTIADVLFSFDYTALHSFDYAQQVMRDLATSFKGERPFSFRRELPDQWYDLHNPDQTNTPMAVRWTLRREDFPPNLESIHVAELALYFVSENDRPVETTAALAFRATAEAAPLGGTATTVGGRISTRQSNGRPWDGLQKQVPFGHWDLTLPNDPALRSLFNNQQVRDLLFVITYSARTPDWPA